MPHCSYVGWTRIGNVVADESALSSVHVLQGCYEKAREFVGEQADILVGCAFTFAFSVVGIQYLDFFVTVSVSD